MIKNKAQFGLSSLRKDSVATSKHFLDEIQKELVAEEQETFKDFIKAAYRLVLEKEKEIENLQKEVAKIRSSIDSAQGGEWDALGEVKIPARFFKEETLRQHGKSLISGNSEVRFVDLYLPEDRD